MIAPDSFSGFRSARAAAELIARGICSHPRGTEAELVLAPMADGGRGVVDVVRGAIGGHWVEARVPDALGRPFESGYLVLPGSTSRDSGLSLRSPEALIETALVHGLGSGAGAPRCPRRATTEGLGVLVRRAAAEGIGTLWVGLGGSATVDGGVGLSQALGYRFVDGRTRRVGVPDGDLVAALDRVRRVDASGRVQWPSMRILGLADVHNPLLGPQGTVAVYGRQKGVEPSEESGFERALSRLADVMEPGLRARRREELREALEGAGVAADGRWADLPGAGAAGGLGWGLMAFAGARLVSGASWVAEVIGLEATCAGAELVITGEGRLDRQSFMGKVADEVIRVSRRSSDGRAAVVAVVGSVDTAWGPVPLRRGAAVEEPGLDAFFSASEAGAAEPQEPGARDHLREERLIQAGRTAFEWFLAHRAAG